MHRRSAWALAIVAAITVPGTLGPERGRCFGYGGLGRAARTGPSKAGAWGGCQPWGAVVG